MNEIVTSLLGDCLAAKGVAFSGGISTTVGGAIRSLIHKRHEMLREVVLSEIRQGNFKGVDQDELISVYFRLIRDAEEGVAKINLRLMARMVNGMAEKNELKASSFLRYANVLASLTDDEINVLAIMIKGSRDKNGKFSAGHQNPGQDELIKNMKGRYRAIQQSLLRTGFLDLEVSTYLEERRVRTTLGGPLDKVVGMDATNEHIFCLTSLTEDLVRYIESFEFERV